MARYLKFRQIPVNGRLKEKRDSIETLMLDPHESKLHNIGQSYGLSGKTFIDLR